jgi:hypothetical protein
MKESHYIGDSRYAVSKNSRGDWSYILGNKHFISAEDKEPREPKQEGN